MKTFLKSYLGFYFTYLAMAAICKVTGLLSIAHFSWSSILIIGMLPILIIISVGFLVFAGYFVWYMVSNIIKARL